HAPVAAGERGAGGRRRRGDVDPLRPGRAGAPPDRGDRPPPLADGAPRRAPRERAPGRVAAGDLGPADAAQRERDPLLRPRRAPLLPPRRSAGGGGPPGGDRLGARERLAGGAAAAAGALAPTAGIARRR